MRFPCPEALLDTLVRYAWEIGNERMLDLYHCRANPGEALPEAYAAKLEREARSMLAFHEHVQGQGVAS